MIELSGLIASELCSSDDRKAVYFLATHHLVFALLNLLQLVCLELGADHHIGRGSFSQVGLTALAQRVDLFTRQLSSWARSCVL
jgi:hypothetical protein